MGKQQKKVICLLLTLMMLFALTACGSSQAAGEESTAAESSAAAESTSAGVFTPGQYQSAQDGKNGPVAVTVTFDEKAIVSVEVGDHSETPGVSDPAIERIPAAVVENQSLAVDVVAGASMTSQAILTGVADCVRQAGAKPDDFMTAVDTVAGATIEKDCDLVIVGAGASGLTAGITASSMGLDVLILEKGVNAAVSNGAQAGGPIAVGTKVQAAEGEDLTMETLYTRMSGFANSTINDALLRNVLELSGETIDMLDDLGLNIYLRQDAYGVAFRARHGFSDRLLDRTNPQTDEIEANGGEFMYETAGKEILMDESGKAVGVFAEQADGTKVIVNAKAVLIATGGYLGSAEMIQEKFGNVNVNPLGNVLSTGDGIKMVTEVGGLESRNWGIVANEFSATNQKAGAWSFACNENLRFGIYGTLLVNKDGNRFFNEEIMASAPLCGAESTLRQGTYYAVVDDAYYQSVGTVGIFETLGQPESWIAGVRNLSAEAPESRAHAKILTNASAQLQEAIDQGWAYKADTLDELADYFGLENLPETVDAYNEFCAKGEDTQFYKDAAFLTPVEKGPFYVFEYEASAWCTLGGVKVDDSLHVIDASNEPIPGLYAAGLDAGSMFSAPYYDNEGSAFGLSLASGVLAARNIADELGIEE